MTHRKGSFPERAWPATIPVNFFGLSFLMNVMQLAIQAAVYRFPFVGSRGCWWGFADAYANNPSGPEEVGLEKSLRQRRHIIRPPDRLKYNIWDILASCLLSLSINAMDSTLMFIAQESVEWLNSSRDEEATRICVYKIWHRIHYGRNVRNLSMSVQLNSRLSSGIYQDM